MDIRNLRKERVFKNDKIEIKFYKGDISKSLSVYLLDDKGDKYHVYWKIVPDRCYQGFNKTNKKVYSFVEEIVKSWITEDINQEVKRKKIAEKKKKKQEKENKIRDIINNF